MNRSLRAPVLGLGMAFCVFAQTYTISTFAGGGFPDIAPAKLISLGAVSSVAVDPTGNVFVALPDYHIVAKMDVASGLMSRVAGNGTSGYTGDGGPAVNAQLQYPTGIAVDSSGTLFIADGGASVIRKVVNGVISTVAGTGKFGFSGDDGPATAAQLNGPSAIAVDAASNLFIADTSNLRVREVRGGIIRTIAGDGTIGMNNGTILPPIDGPALSSHLDLPRGIAVDAAGDVYVSDTYSHCVRKISGGMITTVAGQFVGPYSPGDGGLATAATLKLPSGLAIDSSGSLYIADYLDYRVRKVTNGIISTVAGTGSSGATGEGAFSGDGGPANNAELSKIWGVAVDGFGNIYIADTGNLVVRKVTAGIITTVAGHGAGGLTGDGGPAAASQLSTPSGLAKDSQGNLYIADTKNHAVRMISQGIITTVAGTGEQGYSGDGGEAKNARLNNPLSVAVDAAGNVYIADSGNNVVRKVSGGVISTVMNAIAGTTSDGTQVLQIPSAVAVDSTGALYVATYFQYRQRFPGGIYFTVTAGQIRKIQDGVIVPVQAGSIGYVSGLLVDASGNLFFSDRTSSRVSNLSHGSITVVAGTGKSGFAGDNGPATTAQLGEPGGIFIDEAGALWIADTGNERVRKVVNGVITTVAGAGPPPLLGMPQFGGDGGPATSAQLNAPMAVVTDGAGRAFVADSGNQRVRILVPSDSCSATVQFGPLQFDAPGGSSSANIFTSPACAWSITGLPQWITPERAGGTGPATIGLVVSANPGPARTVTFVVAGNSVTITQSAATYTVSGHVTLKGKPLAGVFLGLSNQASGRSSYTTTDTDGYYSLVFPAETSVYNIGASLAGYSFLTALGDGIFLSTAQVLPFGDQTRDFTAWPNPRINGISAAFPSAMESPPLAFAPGEIVSIYGDSLCGEPKSANAPLPNALGGCGVWIGSVKLPVYYSSAGQINAVLPQSLTTGPHSMVVWRYTDSSNSQLAAQSETFPIQITPVSMDFVEMMDGGTKMLAVQFPNGTFAGEGSPLKPGDVLSLYLTGLGARSQTFPDGTAPGVPSAAVQQLEVMVENLPAAVLYAGAQPEYPGLDQIVVQLPQYALPAGKKSVKLLIRAPSVSQSVTYDVPATQ